MSYDLFAGMLKMSAPFREGAAGLRISYERGPELAELAGTYRLKELAGEGAFHERAVRLLCWLSAHTAHKGDYDNHVSPCALPLLEYAFDRPESGINCACLSAVLEACCLSLGIPARTVSMLPLSPYDSDNHVTCEIWSPERAKWMLLDPTYSCYVLDGGGRILNALELRRALGEREELFLSKEAHYNGAPVDSAEVWEYYAKDLFYLQLPEKAGYGVHADPTQRLLTIAPEGYDAELSRRTNLAYRRSLYGDHPWIDESIAYLDTWGITYASPSLLTAPPQW